MHGVAIIAVEGSLETLPPNTLAHDVVDSPMYKQQLRGGYVLAWSVAGGQNIQVNDLASAAAGQMVRGDAVLCHSISSPPDLQACLASLGQQASGALRKPKPLPHQPLLQPQAAEPSLPRAGPSTTHAMLQQLLSLRNQSALTARPPAAAAARPPPRLHPNSVPPAAPAQPPADIPPAPATPPRPPLTAAPARRRSQPARRFMPADPPAKPPLSSLPSDDEQLFAPLQPAPPVNWADLCALTLTTIIGHLQGSVASVAAMAGVCRSWRAAILGDPHLLKGLPFRLDPAHPFQRASCDCCALVAAIPRRLNIRTYPQLLEQAARAGNAAAAAAIALLEERQGRGGELAMRWWRRAAKAGHAGAQLRLGVAHYEAASGVHHDPEEAHLWLSRGLKQVLPKRTSADGSGSSTPPDWTPEAADPPLLAGSPPSYMNVPLAASPPALASSPPGVGLGGIGQSSAAATAGGGVAGGGPLLAVDEALVGRACLVMGYLHFDGEGGSRCRLEAVKYFKAAAARGEAEAQEALGWIFNTGQYG